MSWTCSITSRFAEYGLIFIDNQQELEDYFALYLTLQESLGMTKMYASDSKVLDDTARISIKEEFFDNCVCRAEKTVGELDYIVIPLKSFEIDFCKSYLDCNEKSLSFIEYEPMLVSAFMKLAKHLKNAGYSSKRFFFEAPNLYRYVEHA